MPRISALRRLRSGLDAELQQSVSAPGQIQAFVAMARRLGWERHAMSFHSEAATGLSAPAGSQTASIIRGIAFGAANAQRRRQRCGTRLGRCMLAYRSFVLAATGFRHIDTGIAEGRAAWHALAYPDRGGGSKAIHGVHSCHRTVAPKKSTERTQVPSAPLTVLHLSDSSTTPAAQTFREAIM